MRRMVALFSCMALMWALAGGSALAVEKEMVCPTCKATVVKKARPKGGQYVQMKHLCPSCGKEHKGTAMGEEIHVCSKCDAEISECPVCQSKM